MEVAVKDWLTALAITLFVILFGLLAPLLVAGCLPIVAYQHPINDGHRATHKHATPLDSGKFNPP